MTGKFYGKFFLKALGGGINLNTDTIKVMLCTDSYTANQDTHEFKSDVTNEISGYTGYTAGGSTLTGVSLTYDATSKQVRMLASNVTLNNATVGGVRKIVVYKDTGTASTSPLIGYITLDADRGVTNGTFELQFTDGIVLYVDVDTV